MVQGDAEGVKTGGRLAVKTHDRFMKGMPGTALAGLKGLDARSPKTGYGARDSGIDLPITALRRLSGHGEAYSPVSNLGGTNAQEITAKAHDGQKDKAGRPYIEHVARVAGRATNPRQATIAWLHDVVEDTGTTPEDLHKAGFDARTLTDVDLLTRRPGERYQDYIRRIADAADADARAVKLADLRGHLKHRPEAIGASLRRRYEEALRTLGEKTPTRPGEPGATPQRNAGENPQAQEEPHRRDDGQPGSSRRRATPSPDPKTHRQGLSMPTRTIDRTAPPLWSWPAETGVTANPLDRVALEPVIFDAPRTADTGGRPPTLSHQERTESRGA